MQVELLEKIKETEDTYSFIFGTEEEIEWKPGQFIFYRIPHKDPDERGIKRHFTISSAPCEKNIRLTSRFDLENGSSFKQALYRMEPGMKIEAFNIGGKFTLGQYDRKYALLAGGIGITPYRAILLDLVHRGKEPDMTMIYGNKDNDIVFRDTLDKLEDENEWLDIDYIIEPDLIDEEVVRRNVEDVYNTIFYVSGPLKMVQIMKDLLLDMNIEKTSIVADYFPGYGE